MKKLQLVLAFVLLGVLTAAIGGGAAWWLLRPAAGAAAKTEKAATEVEHKEYRYVSLDKVIVMLRSTEGEPLSHYLALDLVFKTPLDQEKTIKQHLPLLRSITVRAMSAYTLEKAGQMSVEAFAADINRAFDESYQREPGGKPFVEALIGKLIIE